MLEPYFTLYKHGFADYRFELVGADNVVKMESHLSYTRPADAARACRRLQKQLGLSLGVHNPWKEVARA
ncbi:hypothetical protein [Hymenobacter sp.]|uniref:hypothetical protein n=1 Tax=Hymenobacter sp. TaxID=1898978 RepID=UPI00286AD592|nr:hypothetical protein [Hymenobacter sp.]